MFRGALLLAGAIFVPAAIRAAPSEPAPIDWSVALGRSEISRKGQSLFYGSPGARWDYAPGVLLLSLWRLSERTGDPQYAAYAREAVDSFVTPSGEIRTYRPRDFNLDQIKMGDLVLALYARTHEPRYRLAAGRLRRQLAAQPRTAEGGFWHKARYPHQMWLDGLYMASPFLARYGALFGQPEDLDDAVNQFRVAGAHTYDPKAGLFAHGWDESRKMGWADKTTGRSPEFWSRALGWYGLALTDVIGTLPPGHPGRTELADLLRKLAEGVLAAQDPASGVWWQVTDQGGRPGNYLEASGSAMLVATLADGVRLGVLGRNCLPAIRRGYAGLVRQFIRTDASGAVSLIRVCEMASLSRDDSGSFDYYIGQPVVANDMKGTGPFILAGIAMDRLEAGR